MNPLSKIKAWHRAARPNPTARDFDVQLGCHFEEVVEMLQALDINTEDAAEAVFWLDKLARKLKTGAVSAVIKDRVQVLDSICDQIVTGVGVGYCAGMAVPEATVAVNESNWSKFVDGQPVRDANGKIAKGPNYFVPDLSAFV